MKKFLGFIFKLFLSLLFTLILIELGLRLFPSVIPLDLLVFFHPEPKAQIAHSRGLPTRGWDTVPLERDDGGPELRILRPYTNIVWPIEDNGTINRVTMDENGFCNPPENSYQRPTIDIITLGDSFTTCHAVSAQETWTSQLAAQTGLSAYNLGRVGIGIHEYLQIFKKFGLQKSPKLVILNIYEGNDLRDAMEYYDYVHYKSEYNLQALFTSPTESADYLNSYFAELLGYYSYAFNLISAAVEYAQTNKIFELNPGPSSPRKTNFRYRLVFSEDDVVAFNPSNTDRDEVQHAKLLQNKYEAINIGVELTISAALSTFVQLAEQHNFIPVVSYTPSAHTAYAEHVVFDDPTLLDLMPLVSRDQRRFLKMQGEELGYIFIDLTPALQAATRAKGSQDLLYYRYDLHLTPAGHTVVAEALYTALNDLGMITELYPVNDASN